MIVSRNLIYYKCAWPAQRVKLRKSEVKPIGKEFFMSKAKLVDDAGGLPLAINFFACLFRYNRYKSAAILFFITGLSLFISVRDGAAGFSRAESARFQRSIIDHRRALNRRYKKTKRTKTKYIIVHTSEAGLKSTLTVVSEGKAVRRRRTHGGHTHYVIARNGRTYRILDKRYRADHAGLSMWNGETDISGVSIGIELVGYHYTPITDRQYQSVGMLIDTLKNVYKLDDRAVLTHSQVAYGKPNIWIKELHRGRKKCANNFSRSRAGLGPSWSFDPDVKAGRLAPDLKLAAVFYGGRDDVVSLVGSSIVTASNTAWSIAGEDYDSPTTLYRLPDGKLISGDRIEKIMGWNRIPKQTVVLLNQENSAGEENAGPVKTISGGLTAWTFAGPAYKSNTTFYFLPNGRMKTGQQISDWDDLPSNTQIIIGYREPLTITRGRLPIKIAGKRYNDEKTLYYFPNKKLIPGDQIKSFNNIPAGVLVFLPKPG